MNGLSDIHRNRSLRNFSNLQYLNLSYNGIGQHTICRILKHMSTPLTHLLLNGTCSRRNHSPCLDFNKMMQFSCLQRLEHFELGSSYLRKVGLDLVEFLRNCSGTLLVLSLRNNSLTDKSIPDLLKLLEPPFTIKTLYLDANEFSSAGMEQLFQKDENIVL